MPAGLIALALGGFGIGLTEFVIAGLLPEVAQDFGVDEAAAGLLVSGYALSVVVGALLVTAAVARFPRKPVLLGLMVLFIVGNLISAVAPVYSIMMSGRAIAALCHGAFFGIGSVLAASLVSPDKKASAIAVMFSGLTISNVLGVPFGTFVGQAFGWRSTFYIISALGVVTLIGIWALVPGNADEAKEDRPSLRSEFAALKSGQVWASVTVTVLAFGGMFGAFTYIAYILTEVSGFSSSAVPWLLVIFGLGLFVGNFLGARAADKNLDRTLIVIIAVFTVVMVGYALVAQNSVASVVALLLMGGFGFATVPGLQMRVLRYAPQAPTLASGVNIAAFNFGNAIGAWLGGVAIAAGFGYTSPIWIGAAFGLAALAVIVIAALSASKGASQRSAEYRPVASA